MFQEDKSTEENLFPVGTIGHEHMSQVLLKKEMDEFECGDMIKEELTIKEEHLLWDQPISLKDTTVNYYAAKERMQRSLEFSLYMSSYKHWVT